MRTAAACCIALFPTLLPGQSPAGSVRSGPKVSAELSPVTVYAPVGPRAGETFDAVASMRNAKAGAILFVHELTRETAPAIRAMGAFADEYQLCGLRVAIVVLHADRNEAEAMARRASGSLRMSQSLWASVDGAEGPGPWALNPRATVTLTLVRGGKVAQSFGLTDTGRQDAGRFRTMVEELVGPVPKDPAARRQAALDELPSDPEALRAWAAELSLRLWQKSAWPQPQNRRRQQGRRMPDSERAPARGRGDASSGTSSRSRPAVGSKPVGSPPEDEQLRSLLRRVIRGDATSEDLDAGFSAIEVRAQESDDLRGQVREMFLLMQRLPYATQAAKSRARAWIDAQGKGAAKRSTGSGGGAPKDAEPINRGIGEARPVKKLEDRGR